MMYKPFETIAEVSLGHRIVALCETVRASGEDMYRETVNTGCLLRAMLFGKVKTIRLHGISSDTT